MGNPVMPPQWKEIETAAHALRLEPLLFDVRSGADIDKAFDAAASRHIDALVVSVESLTQANADHIAALAISHRLPTIYASREFVEVGGLVSYGVSYPDLYLRAAAYIDKIFKGARPAELPVEQPTKFELVINLKTARALALDVPPLFLTRADDVIE
jgi:putative ABC transport system substrate-binding protein